MGGRARPVVACGVRYEYPDGTVGLESADVRVEAGERVAVVGPNGSGKSTLMQLLGGLLEPSTGRVEFFEETTDPEAVRRRIGAVTQDPDDYLFSPTVREDLEYGPAQLGVPVKRADERIADLVDELDLHGLLDRPPFRLSGGEKERAALACALAVDPDLLLLDEPVGSLDATNRRTVVDLLNRLNERGVTLVTFTPDVDLVPRVADRVYLVGPGKAVAATGPTREVLTDVELLAECGLEAPAVVRLFGEGALALDRPPLDVAEARRTLEAHLGDDVENG